MGPSVVPRLPAPPQVPQIQYRPSVGRGAIQPMRGFAPRGAAPGGRQDGASTSIALLPAPPRVYQMRADDAFSAPIAIGTIHIHDMHVRILFDTGATHYFIAMECVRRLSLAPTQC